MIAGRLSLLPAAAAFRDMQDPKWLPGLLDSNRGAASIDEVYCRSVIGYVGARPPDRAKEVARRLEAELSARLRDGTLHLPEP